MSTVPDKEPEAVATGLRVMAASLICLLVGEWWHLDLIYMSLFSAHMVMSQYTFTSFQKGVERILGRVLGIGYGLLLIVLFRDVPLLFLSFLVAWQIALFYLNGSGHLAYMAMQAGIFAPTVAQIGMTGDSAGALRSGTAMLIQVILGVVSATVVNGLTGAENSMHVETKGQALTPLRLDWLSHSIMFTTMAMITLLVTMLLQLPVVPTMVSATIVGMALDPIAMRRKAFDRGLAVLLGGAYAFVGLLVLARVQSFALLLVWTTFGMFMAAYLTRMNGTHAYAGLQAGMVVPMVLVGSGNDFGAVLPAVERFVGVVIGSTISLTVEYLWPPVAAPASAK